MNFIKLMFKLKFIFILIIFISPAPQSLASVPIDTLSSTFINNFPLPEEISKPGLSSFQFGQKGIIYITSSRYLWIYDGILWHKVYAGLNPKVTISDSLGVFVYANKKLLELIPDERGRLKLKQSRTDLLITESVNDLIFYRDSLLILTDKEIFIVRDHKCIPLYKFNSGTLISKPGDMILTRVSGKNSILMPDLSLRSLPGNLIPYDFLPDSSGRAIATDTSRDNLLLLEENMQSAEARIRTGVKIKDICVTEAGNIYSLLEDNSVWHWEPDNGNFSKISDPAWPGKVIKMIPSSRDRIWLVANTEIKILEYSSRIKEIFVPGMEAVKELMVVDSSLIMLIDSGLMDLSGKLIFKLDGRNSGLFRAEDNLLIETPVGLFLYDSREREMKKSFLGGRIIDCSNRDPFFLLQENDSIKICQVNTESNISVLAIIPDEKGSEYCLIGPLLFSVSEDSLELWNVSQDKREYLPIPEVFTGEYPVRIIKTGRSLWLYNSEYVFSFDTVEKNFTQMNILFSTDQKTERIHSVDRDLILIKLRSRALPGSFILYNLENQQYRYFNLPFIPVYYSGYFVSDFNAKWFILGSRDKAYLVSKDTPKLEDTYFPILTRMLIEDDTVINDIGYIVRFPVGEPHIKKISRIKTDINLSFSGSDFLYPSIYCQYQLGPDSEWSDWKEGAEIKLKEIPAGEYSLAVRLMNSMGMISKTDIINLNIVKPFLLRGPALTLIFVIFLIVSFVIYKRIKLYRLNINPDESETLKVKTETPEHIEKEALKTSTRVVGTVRKDRWDKYEMVTVLFSDIQGFTRIAEEMNPEKLIDELDKFFFHFDSVVEKYNIEKIKTIGDAYMAAGGIPRKNRSNPVEVVLAALEMQQYMKNLQKTKVDFWDLRIGIHSGPVIAGVIGHKKRSYDIWGDTVNTASRMESSGEAGRVNISGETYTLVKEYFLCEYRGKLPVKYKGNLDMYFVRGLRPELSINLGELPNRKFFLRLQLLRLIDLEDHVFRKLDEETPLSFVFHTPEYARHLYSYSDLLSKAENLDLEETLLVKTAVLLLVIGIIENYSKPEIAASAICNQILSEFNYSDKQIQDVGNLILASKYPPEPQTLLEKIMVDIRFEYLGRVDFLQMYKLYYQEQKEYYGDADPVKWKEKQIELLRTFQYFTAGAGRLSEISFNEQIERILSDDRE